MDFPTGIPGPFIWESPSHPSGEQALDVDTNTPTNCFYYNILLSIILTLIFSASLLAISEEFWYLMTGHFFNDNKTAKIPWHERSNASVSHDPP